MVQCERTELNSSSVNFSSDLFAGNVLGAFARALSDKVEQAVCEATGLSSSACSAIVTVGSEPDSSIETLRRMLSLEHSSLVRLLDRLEQRGFLRRIRGSNVDQRMVSVSLTDEGEDCFTAILDARRATLEEVMLPLGSAERKLMIGMVAKMMPHVVDPGDDQHYVCRLCDLEVCPQTDCPVNLAYPDLFELPDQPFRRKVSACQSR